MAYSLNEIDAMVLKAARGVGLSWGLAQEAGRAARWLTVAGIDGAALAADVLAAHDGNAQAMPGEGSAGWHADGGPCCPLLLGAALSDRLPEVRDGFAAELRHTLFLAPFLAPFQAMQGQGQASGVRITGAATALTVFGRCCQGYGAPRDMVTIAVCDGAPPAHVPRHSATVDPKVWALLDRFAGRTYAPATEASRLAGAGAGTTDND